MMFIIAGRFKKRKVVTPRNMITRPTLGKVRETLFNICQSEIEGASFLDLFAGSGTMGLEALSRGAKRVTFIEKDRSAIKAIEANIKSFQIESEVTLIKGDVFKALQYLSPFDIIFADPPYGKGMGEKVVEMVKKYELLKGSLFIEEDHQLPEQDSYELLSSRKTGRTILHHYS